jgi:hypothetical protein
MMRRLFMLAGLLLIFSATLIAQSKAPFDPHDLSGAWGRFGSRVDRGNNQGSPFREGGDAGFNNDVPPMTAEGETLLEGNKTGYGRPLGSELAKTRTDEHYGRRRAVPPALGNDPTGECTPAGLTRNILSTYFSPFEFVHAKDRIIHHFEWTNEWREIFTDGRKLPEDPDVLRWNGYSVGRWDGDTFVVDSYGFEPTTWVDHFGYPHSEQMRLEERYKRTAADRLELVMTINDPKIYTKPWVSQKKVFRLLTKEEVAFDGWGSLIDDRCVPAEEKDFNDKVRDPAGGIVR